MRTLGIDHGSVRIGLAVSDELGMIAQPLEWVAAVPFEAFVRRLEGLLEEKQVSRIVVGLPRNMDGSYGPAAAAVREFVAALAAVVRVPIKTWDERLTTAQAHRALASAGVRHRKRRGAVDAMAAAILLQSYLDAQAALG
jgi:putative Holliday junction resolvase